MNPEPKYPASDIYRALPGSGDDTRVATVYDDDLTYRLIEYLNEADKGYVYWAEPAK